MKYCWLFTFSLLLWFGEACAQESAGAPADEPNSPALSEVEITTAPTDDSGDVAAPPSPLLTNPWQTDERAQTAAPDVYLLPDEFGKLRKVVGFRYEDFFEAWKQLEMNGVVAPPRYVVDALDISGEVLQKHARLRIEFQITLQDSNWTDIPIQLPNFIIQQSKIEGQEEGECLVYDKERHGHVVWLSGRAAKKRVLVLDGLAKLKLNTGNHGLELYLPRAITSQFILRVPDSNSRFEGSPELELTTVALGDNATEVRLLGQVNPLRLNWTPEEEDVSNQTALIEVEGQTSVHLDRRRISYDTTLQIRSFESPLEQIQVSLPDGAKLQMGETSLDTSLDYEIKVLPASSIQNRRQIIEIRLQEPRRKSWQIRLLAESPLESVSESAEAIVEGFEVLEASRQSGLLTIDVDDQLEAYFDTHGDIDQIPIKKLATAPTDRSILGKFRYARFPWKLIVFTSPRQKRVSVKPKYDLSISSEEASLDVEYDYQLTGAQIFSLRVNLQGWKLTDAPIESGGLINSDGVVETRDGRLVLPLVDPNTQQLRLNLSLRKDIEFGDNTFYLPEPLEVFVVDGGLSVDSSESLQVTPKLDEMTGLSVIAATDEEPLATAYPNAAQQVGSINLRTFLPQPKFVAEVTQRQRQIVVLARTEVEMDQQIIRVRQQLDYQSKYRPVSQLSLNLPEQLWTNDSLSVTLGGKQLPFGLGNSLGGEPLDSTNDELVSKNSVQRQMVVSLPRPIQNDIPIEIAYEIPAPDLATDEGTAVLLPLATPHDTLSSHEVLVSAAPPVLVTTNQRSPADDWQVITGEEIEERAEGNTAESRADDAAAVLRLRTDENLSYLSLYAQLDSADKIQLATLERAWIQTWMIHDQQQERAVFRFRTPHTAVFVQLPAVVDNTEIEVVLDGRPWTYEVLEDNRVAIQLFSNGKRLSEDTVPSNGTRSSSGAISSQGRLPSSRLPPNGQLDRHTLELRTLQATTLPSWGELHISMPRLESRMSSAPVYWQLILPRSWQLASSPQQLVADYWLGWKNYRWGRQPTHSQADLEQITGAVSAESPPPLSSQYVYRAFEIPATIRVVVIRRALLVVTGVLAAFGIGLLWVYTPLAQSGVFWLSVSLALLAGIFSYPEVSQLAIQVILAGGLMTFVTGVLRRIFTNGHLSQLAATVFPQESSTELTESSRQMHPDGRSDATATTATLRTSEPLP